MEGEENLNAQYEKILDKPEPNNDNIQEKSVVISEYRAPVVQQKEEEKNQNENLPQNNTAPLHSNQSPVALHDNQNLVNINNNKELANDKNVKIENSTVLNYPPSQPQLISHFGMPYPPFPYPPQFQPPYMHHPPPPHMIPFNGANPHQQMYNMNPQPGMPFYGFSQMPYPNQQQDSSNKTISDTIIEQIGSIFSYFKQNPTEVVDKNQRRFSDIDNFAKSGILNTDLKITKIRVQWSRRAQSEYITGCQLYYNYLKTGEFLYGDLNIGEELPSSQALLTLNPNEFLIRVEGCKSDYIQQISFHSSMGRVWNFGKGGSNNFKYEASQGNHLILAEGYLFRALHLLKFQEVKLPEMIPFLCVVESPTQLELLNELKIQVDNMIQAMQNNCLSQVNLNSIPNNQALSGHEFGSSIGQLNQSYAINAPQTQVVNLPLNSQLNSNNQENSANSQINHASKFVPTQPNQVYPHPPFAMMNGQPMIGPWTPGMIRPGFPNQIYQGHPPIISSNVISSNLQPQQRNSFPNQSVIQKLPANNFVQQQPSNINNAQQNKASGGEKNIYMTKRIGTLAGETFDDYEKMIQKSPNIQPSIYSIRLWYDSIGVNGIEIDYRDQNLKGIVYRSKNFGKSYKEDSNELNFEQITLKNGDMLKEVRGTIKDNQITYLIVSTHFGEVIKVGETKGTEFSNIIPVNAKAISFAGAADLYLNCLYLIYYLQFKQFNIF